MANYDAARSDSRWDAAAAFIAERLLLSVVSNPSHYAALVETLRPISAKLLASLSLTFRDKKRAESERSLASNILADYAADRPDVLADLLLDSDEKPFAVLFERLLPHREQVLSLMEAALAKRPASGTTDDARDRLARRRRTRR